MGKSQLIYPVVEKSWWERTGRHYATSIIWIVIVTCSAYLPLLVKFFLSEETFFECYAATQNNWIAVATNASFWAFVLYDYLNIFGMRGSHWSWIFVVLALICLTIIPFMLDWYIEHNKIYNIRSFSFSFYLGYIPHILYLFCLYMLRAETSRYTISLIEKSYTPTVKQA
jgi:hypothetical protein